MVEISLFPVYKPRFLCYSGIVNKRGVIMAKTKVQEFKALEQELAKKAKEIKKQVELVHSIIGKDLESSNREIYKVVGVEERLIESVNRVFVIVSYIEYKNADTGFSEKAYILKSTFDLTEQELRENQEQLKQELETINQQQQQCQRGFRQSI